jgi:hypothetical protein
MILSTRFFGVEMDFLVAIVQTFPLRKQFRQCDWPSFFAFMKVHKIGVVIKRDQIEYLFYTATMRFYVALSVDLKRQIWAKRLQYIPQSYERLIDIALGVQLDQVWFFRRMNVQAHLWNLLRIIVSHSADGYMRPHRCVRYLNELYRLGLSANGSSHSGDVLYAV